MGIFRPLPGQTLHKNVSHSPNLQTQLQTLIRTELTLEVEVNVGVAVSKLVEGVAPVHAAVLQAGVLDGERENVLVLLHWTAPEMD